MKYSGLNGIRGVLAGAGAAVAALQHQQESGAPTSTEESRLPSNRGDLDAMLSDLVMAISGAQGQIKKILQEKHDAIAAFERRIGDNKGRQRPVNEEDWAQFHSALKELDLRLAQELAVASQPQQQVAPPKIDQIKRIEQGLENARKGLVAAQDKLKKVQKEAEKSLPQDKVKDQLKKAEDAVQKATARVKGMEDALSKKDDIASQMEERAKEREKAPIFAKLGIIGDLEATRTSLSKQKVGLEAEIAELGKQIEGGDTSEPARKKLEDLRVNLKGLDKNIEGLNAEISANDARKIKLREFLEQTQNEGLGRKLFGDGFKAADKNVFEDSAIINAFKSRNEDLEYFKESDLEDLGKIYLEFYKALYYQWVVMEQNPNPEEVHSYAYKYMAVFLEYSKEKGIEGNLDSSCKNLDRFISNYCGSMGRPIHDLLADVQFPAFMDEITRKPAFDLSKWQKLIKENGVKALKEFGFAPNIKDLGTYEELIEAIKKLRFKRADENPELAELFNKYKVAETRFDEALNVIASGRLKTKTTDKLPNVTLDVAKESVATSRKNYYLMRLPAGDPRGLILGDITVCCQSIGGNSEECVIDGMSRDNNGFYVLVKTKDELDERALVAYESSKDAQKEFWRRFEEDGNKIVGQGYVWRSQAGNIVFDSWENRTPESDDPWMKDILGAFAKKLVDRDKTVSRVTIGRGGKTPAQLKSNPTTAPDAMIEGYHYGDSSTQYVILESEALVAIKKELVERINRLGLVLPDLEHIIFIDSCTRLRSLSDTTLSRLVKHTSFKRITAPAFLFAKADIEDFYVKLFQNSTKLQLLVSNEVEAGYRTGYIKASDLVNLNSEIISFLISDHTIYIYRLAGMTAQAIIAGGTDSLLTIKKTMLRQVARVFSDTVGDLDGITEDRIELLLSIKALEAYKTGQVKPAELVGLDVEKIKFLISSDVINLYKSKITTAESIIAGGTDTLSTMKKTALRLVAEKYGDSIENLDRVPDDRIELLLSIKALEAYKTGQVNPAGLVGLDDERIKFLISSDVINLYKSKITTAESIIAGGTDTLSTMKKTALRLVAEKYGGTIRNLDGVPDDRIELLLSIKALEAYRKGKVKPSDLIGPDDARVKLLLSDEALNAYDTGGVKPSDLADLDIEKIKALTSAQARSAYETRIVEASDLVWLNHGNIIFLISAYYSEGFGITTVINNASTSKMARALVKLVTLRHMDNPEDVDTLSDDFINSSWFSIIKMYKIPGVKFDVIKGLGVDKLKKLATNQVLQLLIQGNANAGLISRITDEQINLLYGAINCRLIENNWANIEDLLKKGDPRIIEYIGKVGFLRNRGAKTSVKRMFGELVSFSWEKFEIICNYGNLFNTNNKAGSQGFQFKFDYEELDPMNKTELEVQDYFVQQLSDSFDSGVRVKFRALLPDLLLFKAIGAFKSGWVKPNDFMEVTDNRVIQLLVSPNVIRLYKDKKVDPSTLAKLDYDTANLVISGFVDYGFPVGAETDMRSLKVKMARAIAGKYGFFIDIDSIPPHELDRLVSVEIQKHYKTGVITMNDLIGLDSEKYNLLTSAPALKAYKTHALQLSKLKELSCPEIQTLINLVNEHPIRPQILSVNGNESAGIGVLRQYNAYISYIDNSSLSNKFLEEQLKLAQAHKQGWSLLDYFSTSAKDNYVKAEEVEKFCSKILRSRKEDSFMQTVLSSSWRSQ